MFTSRLEKIKKEKSKHFAFIATAKPELDPDPHRGNLMDLDPDPRTA